MRLLEVRARNFMSIRSAHLAFESQGVICLTGPNGAGKSALLEAIGWAFFGQTPRGAVGAAAVSEGLAAGEQGWVRVDFADRAQRQGWVRRAITVGGGSFELEGWVAGLDIKQNTPTQSQEYLESLLGISWQAWRSAIHFTSQFGFLRLEDAGKKAILDELTGAHRYDAARQRAKQARDRAALELAGVRGDVSTIAERVRSGAALMVQELRHAEERAARAESDRISTEEGVATARAELAIAITQTQALDERIQQYMAARDQLQQLVSRQQEELGLDPGSRLLGVERSLAALAQRRQGLEHDLSQAQTGTCPTCLRPGMDRTRIAWLQQSHEALIVEEASLQESVEATRGAKARWDMAQATLGPARETLMKLTGELRMLEGQCAQGRVAAENAQARITAGEAYLVKLRETPIVDLVGLAQLKTEQEALRERWVALRALERQQRILDFWYYTGFASSGIPACLLEGVLPAINERLAQYVAQLSDGRLALALTGTSETKRGEVREKLGVRVTNLAGSQTLAFNSLGEKAYYDLAVMCAFCDWIHAQAGESIDWICLDEVFDHIAEDALPGVAAFVRELGRDRQVFVVAHQPTLVEAYEDRVRVANPGSGTEFDVSLSRLVRGSEAPALDIAPVRVSLRMAEKAAEV